MASTYRTCPACGKRALTIATRCPGCAYEFPSERVGLQPSRAIGRPTQLLGIVGVLLAVAGLLTLAMRRAAHRDPDTAAPDVRSETPATPDTVSAVAAPVMPDSAASAEAVPRVARTWTKVRARRS